MVVLVIVIIVSAFALPNFSAGISSAQLTAAARDIASALRYARSQAIASTQPAEFVLDVETHSYQVSGRDKLYTLPDDIRFKLYTAEAELQDEQRGAIRFFPDGSSTGGRVTLEANAKRQLIDVVWLTGQVVIRAEEMENAVD
jgi:general secretion pathway protein H